MKHETVIKLAGERDNKVNNVFFDNVNVMYSNWAYPTKYGMIEGQATEYIDILQGTDLNKLVWKMPPAGVEINYADNVTFYNSKIENMGATGISVKGESNNFIMKKNKVSNIAGSGIIFGSFASVFEELDENIDPRFSKNLQKNVDIEDNYVAHIGRSYMGGIGIQGGYATDVDINHNEIHDMGYSGISLGWGWTGPSTARDNLEVRNNKIYDTMNNLMIDGAGVYFLGRFKEGATQNKFIGNYIVCGNGYAGLYFDEGSNNFNVTHNVIEGTGSQGFLLIHDIHYATSDIFVKDNYTETKKYKINSWTNDKKTYKKTSPKSRGVVVEDIKYKKTDESWSVGAKSIIDNSGIRKDYVDEVKNK